jgi:alkylation response protein AidB-like acyl-CoA dehydrogenase
MTRKLARVELRGVPARLVSGPGDATATLSRALDLALAALTAEQVGGAQRCLDMAVDYARIRMQFGRPIGSFQAVKHKCAEMLLAVESAKSAAYHAAGSAAEETSDELGVAAAIAKAYCSEAYFHVAAETIQVHGGIGFTWEHDAHLYFRRAKSSQLFLGDEHYHRERFAALTGI